MEKLLAEWIKSRNFEKFKSGNSTCNTWLLDTLITAKYFTVMPNFDVAGCFSQIFNIPWVF